MAGWHNTSFFPQGVAICIFWMPLENIVTPQLICGRGRVIPSRTPKFGSYRVTTGTFSESLLAASKTRNESVRHARCTTVTGSRLEAAGLKLVHRFCRSWTMTDLTKFYLRKTCDLATSWFI